MHLFYLLDRPEMTQSSSTIEEIQQSIDRVAPFSLAAEWDNVGLMIGDPGQTATGVVIGLDPLPSLLDEAKKKNANLVITHHPPIFHPLKQLRTDQPTGAFIARAVREEIAVISCHTNLDVIGQGVSTVLAEKAGIENPSPLTVTGEKDGQPVGFGQVGDLATPVSGQRFISGLCRALSLHAVPYAGSLPDRVARVAVCGGSGSDLSEAALAAGAEAYITGEVKHSTALWAAQAGLCVIDAGHFATEHLACEAFARLLQQQFSADGIGTPIHTAVQNNPFSLFMQEK